MFPELALTTFFPRWDLDDDELLTFFEREMPSDATQPLFDEAARLGVGFHLGYAELTDDGHRYNTAVLVERDGTVVARYRKVHLPGHEEPEGWRPFQHLERKYFEPGPEGFHAVKAFGGVLGVALCNDRRWSETYRVLGLQGVELLLVGYNTPVHYAPDPEPGSPPGVPQQPGDGVGRVPERHVRGRRGQGRGRGGRRAAGRQPDHRPRRARWSPAPTGRATSWSWRCATSTSATATSRRCSTSSATGVPRCTGPSPRPHAPPGYD